MIRFDFQEEYDFNATLQHKQWIKEIVRRENKTPGDISYCFCSDDYIYQQNVKFLNHDTLTDIITFDNCVANLVQGNILISFDRVEDNAKQFGVELHDEVLRVLAHGVLHLCGYKDKSDDEAVLMRNKENEAIKLYYDFFISKNQ